MSRMELHLANSIGQACKLAAEQFELRARQYEYRKDPAKWAMDRLSLHLWSKQRAIGEALVTNKKVAVKSGHGIGKSFLAAILVLWWVETHIGEDTLVITTGPTGEAVRGIVWEYVRKMHRSGDFIGVVSEQAEWKDNNRDIIGKGIKPADNNNASFNGRHYKYTLVLIDEACGVPAALFGSAEAITTTDTCRILAIGNPVDPNTEFGNIFLGNGGKGLDTWAKITISVTDNPNFTGEKVPQDMLDNLTSQSQVDAWAEKYGRDSNEFKFKVLGEFPESSDSKMFPLHLLYRGMDAVVLPRQDARPVLGVDVARFGGDSSTCISNLDGLITIEGKWNGKTTVEVAAAVHEIAVRTHASEVRVDAAGVGGGVVDQLRVLSVNHDYVVWEMLGNGATPDPKAYRNTRAFWHGHVYDLLLNSKISLPDITHNEEATQLFEEMRELEKKYTPDWGALQIESKDDMRRRNVKSPDFSDALMYACAPLGSPDDTRSQFGPGDMASYDPYDDPDLMSMGFAISPL
jgi:hypothetical protein